MPRTLALLAILGLSIGAGCEFAHPRGVVSEITRQEHPALVDAEMDWGSEVGFVLTNAGDRGMIHVAVTLSSSEGQWNRSQDLLLEAGQSRRLVYFFSEPTINATNFQARVDAEP